MIFNFTLRRNNVRFNYQGRFLYPPAPLLQAMPLVIGVRDAIQNRSP